MNLNPSDPLDRNRFPVDEWALVENAFSGEDMGRTETLFAVGNGYLGLRGNVDEGRDGHVQGTYINGFHETWPIRHAEEAFGFARVGQTIVNAPDAKVIRIYVDDEPLVLTLADLLSYERRLDFADGVLSRSLVWRTPSGKRVLIRSRRVVSFTERHLAVLQYEVTMLDADASVVISSQILNRQDGMGEYDAPKAANGKDFDPRKAESFTDRVLQPRFKRAADGRYLLGFRCTNSGMTIACGADHAIDTANEFEESSQIGDDIAKHVYKIKATQGNVIRITKTLSYHTSTGVPTHELADRCDRTLDRARKEGLEAILTAQRDWLDAFWARTDVQLAGQPSLQQATRWNLFQLAQASMRADGQGVSAKGVSGSGYGGHYFWDTEVYVLPFLTYTSPNAARNALRFRHAMLDHARMRARELNQLGALFPWRTINGLESSAYYAAGTAQYHIDADVSYALGQYVAATGDEDFLSREAIDILVETARMWADLGFWRGNGNDVFHIHGVTGPDEYTTVVNDNLYTNIMARANLRSAVTAVRRLRYIDIDSYNAMVARLGLDQTEVVEWAFAAEAMHIPFDETLGIHPQDAQFLEKERWDLSATPAANRPLLLHYHPLVIYRFQVLKQADVVLALLLQGDQFTAEQKRADFDYYDPITTGDSTLSDVVQSIIAAEVGYHELALKHFTSGLFVDLADLHHNAADGVHVASAGGVWSALVYGFGGLRDHNGRITLDPRLPVDWEELTFRITLKGTRVRFDLRQKEIVLTIEEGDAARLAVRGVAFDLVAGHPVTVPLSHQGLRDSGAPSPAAIEGGHRADGTVITSSIPTIAHVFDFEVND
ncbi:alpha,alpha-trehalose phosphorylase [Cryobacterium sp. MP_M5]|uniref:glycoside hydrolase family 65 protein n=1 Tax=unclassified Cryobacterium TaxID=2649013 RepID=UPI0018C92D78|nr:MULTISPECIES: glycoside hydrolase family 65 protein [unclassified Cryobacterium]MBG6059045.1 alpha,alpha-trehalose phosphorylase [Cryobacterium sp. MP_M3]MEC5177339.1 alpha,alpha-trehalose phosphorylase [Cryobacterium sp. MP_M5]